MIFSVDLHEADRSDTRNPAELQKKGSTYLCKTFCWELQLMAESSFKRDCIYCNKISYSTDDTNTQAVVAILINKDVLEPSYNVLKFAVQKH